MAMKEIWDKIGYNSVCVRDICEIFMSIGGLLGMGRQMMPANFSPSDLRCHDNEIWDKIGYNSAYVRDICEIFASVGGFRGWAIECY